MTKQPVNEQIRQRANNQIVDQSSNYTWLLVMEQIGDPIREQVWVQVWDQIMVQKWNPYD